MQPEPTPTVDRIARAPRVLSALISADLKFALREKSAGAERGSQLYYQLAGEKMLEAKTYIADGDFKAWIRQNLRVSYRQACECMKLAEAAGVEKFAADPNYNRPSVWHQPVASVDTEALNRRREETRRVEEEREAQRKLALRLVDIGYKELSKQLHPDKGGSAEGMARLNAVRDQQKNSAGWGNVNWSTRRPARRRPR